MFWINQPLVESVQGDVIKLRTEPKTDFWQKTLLGFVFDNAPSYVKEVIGDFTFSCRANFQLQKLFDQCGILVYHNAENWIKVAQEIGPDEKLAMGCAVTNLGYSDWAFHHNEHKEDIYYRISRKGQDFVVEYSNDGQNYSKIRICHLHVATDSLKVGVFAASPNDSQFDAVFTELKYQ